MNPAASLLGPLYNLYTSALGNSVGMVVGYATLIGIVALVWWTIANRDDVISGFDLRSATIGNYVILLVVGLALYYLVSQTFGFPIVGAIFVAAVSTILFHWCMTAFENETI